MAAKGVWRSARERSKLPGVSYDINENVTGRLDVYITTSPSGIKSIDDMRGCTDTICADTS